MSLLLRCHADLMATFAVNFGMEACECSNFSKIVLAVPGPLSFHMNFRIGLSVSTQKPAVILTGIEFNLANYPFFIFAWPMVCGSSWARDQTCARAAN